MSMATSGPSTWGHLKQWRSPGETIDRFIASLYLSTMDMADVAKRTAKKIRVLDGPIGSGKTTGILGGCAANAQRQPMSRDGVRHYHLTVLRTDYRLLWSSFISRFWFSWFPKESAFTSWRGAEDQPAEHTIRLNTEFGKTMWHVGFRAIDPTRATPEQISNFWRGQLPCDLWYEEADAFSELIYQGGYSRVGRGVPMELGGPTCPTLFAGTNAPLIGSWMHKRIMSGRWRPGIEYFRQPGARTPMAENLHNLPPGYYAEQIAELEDDMVRRLIDGEYVMPRAGKAVHPEYRDSLHGSAVELEPDEDLELMIGIDPRTWPSAVFAQRVPGGQWRFLDEIRLPHGAGEQSMAEALNAVLARPSYAYWNRFRGEIRGVMDPSATYGATDGELNWLDRVAEMTKIPFVPARSNKARDRRGGMKAALRKLDATGRPSATFSTRVPLLRAALGGMFHYAEINLQGAGSGLGITIDPVKNDYADVAEAAEYITMEFGGLEDAEVPAGATSKGDRYKNYDGDYAEA